MYCDHVAFSQVISRLARLTPETKAHVTGAVLELQGSTLQACDETVDLVSQALQPVTTMPHHVDWCHAHSLSHRICAPICVKPTAFFRRSYWRIVHSAKQPHDISQETAAAHDFVSAFETIFCAPAPLLSSLILARKPPLALLHKVPITQSSAPAFTPLDR